MIEKAREAREAREYNSLSKAREYDVYSKDYLEHKDIDDDAMYRLREIINCLPLAEKKIIVMYMEYGTYSAVAKELKCSVPTCAKIVKKIKKKVVECI